MRNFEFTIVATSIDLPDEAFEDRLYDAGCNDALISVVKGSVLLDFDREAKNLTHAIISAIGDIRMAGLDVIRIEPDSYASVSDIAERSGLTRQSVSLLVQGKRGPGGFPPPSIRISTDSPLWDWLYVARWLHQNRKIKDRTVLVHAAVARIFNRFLESRPLRTCRDRVLEHAISAAVGSGEAQRNKASH